MYQYFSHSIRKEICSLITYQTLCQTVIAYFQNGGVKKKKKNMAAEPLLRSWRAKPNIDPSGSEDTVMSPLHLSVILSASNDLAVSSGKSRPVWCCFVSNVQLLQQQSVPARLLKLMFCVCQDLYLISWYRYYIIVTCESVPVHLFQQIYLCLFVECY